MKSKLYSLLTIAGSDSMGGAGIQADIRIGNKMGFHVMSAITAITSQNSKKLSAIEFVSNYILKKQLESIIEDVIPNAIKIGMIGDKNNFLVISKFLKSLQIDIPIVIDPVLRCSVDNKFLANIDLEEITDLYKKYLFPFATVITPNFEELKALLCESQNINYSHYDILKQLKSKNIIITGGDKRNIQDHLLTPDGIITYKHNRVECINLHGTGCIYSTLLACYLGMGNNVKESFIKSNNMMQEIISKSCDYTLGRSKYGPLNINNYIL